MNIFRIILFLPILCSFFFAIKVSAQNSNSSKQVRIINNLGAIPFEDGKTVIAVISFTGLTALPESEIYRSLREARVEIRVGDNFYGGKVAKAVKIIREQLGVAGFFQPEVTAFGEMISKNQMKLNFLINQGSKLLVSDVIFEGSRSVSNEEFFNNFKSCLEADAWQTYVPQKYVFISRKCSLSLLNSKGFFMARIGQITPQKVNGKVVVTVEVSEGKRFRNGEIRVEGASVFSAAEILSMLGFKKDEISDGRRLMDFVYEELKKKYADRGYVFYDAEFEPIFSESRGETDGIVHIVIRISEGAQFKLSKINFEGVEKERAVQLRKLFPISDGALYSQSKIEEGIKQINDLKEFEPLKFDRNAEKQIDEKQRLVEVIINLSKIKQ